MYKKAINVLVEYSLKCEGVSFCFAFYFIVNTTSTGDGCIEVINTH